MLSADNTAARYRVTKCDIAQAMPWLEYSFPVIHNQPRRTTMAQVFLRLPEVKKRLGFSSTSAIWYKTNPNSNRYDPTFPKPVKIGSKAVAWVESEIDAWQKARMAARHVETAKPRRRGEEAWK